MNKTISSLKQSNQEIWESNKELRESNKEWVELNCQVVAQNTHTEIFLQYLIERVFPPEPGQKPKTIDVLFWANLYPAKNYQYYGDYFGKILSY